MKVLPYLAIFTFVAGLSLLVVGFAFSNTDAAPPTSRPVAAFDLSTPVIPTGTATTPPLDAPTATPTPEPFNGEVARIQLKRLGIDHPVEEIGILPNNELDTPKDALGKVGWYYIYDKPGFGKNSLFSAHVNYNFKNGPFARLSEAEPGDEIIVQMEGGPTYTYSVFRFQRYDVDTIPMGEIIWPEQRPAGEEWITLITCGGRFVATQENGLGQYQDRDVVVAKRIS